MAKDETGLFSGKPGKRRKGEGYYSSAEGFNLRDDDSALGYHRPVDVFEKVERNANRNGGSSAKLDSGE